MLVPAVRDDDVAGVEVIAVDSGPGMVDVARSSGDGHSTAGTLGIGLGAIIRQASWSDLYSVPGKGTVLAAQVWPATAPSPAWASGLIRPLAGEAQSGDGYAVKVRDGHRQALVVDGLGHGPLAAAAAQAAVRVFNQATPSTPAAMIETLHGALSHTRGAAVAVAEIDTDARMIRYAGLGNIAGTIFTDAGVRKGMVSLPGIAGHQKRQVRQYDYPFPPGSTRLMHTDGVVDRWSPADYPGLLMHSPQVIAATVLRDAGTRRDDAGVLVAAV
jgi:hypothetical protein